MEVPDVPAHGGARRMYKTSKEQQLTFDGFNQSCGTLRVGYAEQNSAELNE